MDSIAVLTITVVSLVSASASIRCVSLLIDLSLLGASAWDSWECGSRCRSHGPADLLGRFLRTSGDDSHVSQEDLRSEDRDR